MSAVVLILWQLPLPVIVLQVRGFASQHAVYAVIFITDDTLLADVVVKSVLVSTG